MSELCYCRANDLGLIRVSGRDARQFLHAQTTQRLDDLAASESRLAAWLNAKGRVRALFHVVPASSAFWLILPADGIDYLVHGLRPFVLRADVKLEAETDRAIASLLGPVDGWLTSQDLDLDEHEVAVAAAAILVRNGVERIDVLANPASLAEWSAGLAEADADDFERIAVRQGLPRVDAANRETYIPQMLNLERLGAVSFDKGCYPGQEIVARTQHLGSVKRRLKRFGIGPGSPPEPGSAVVTAGGNPAGEINRVARSDNGFEALAVVALTDEALVLEGDGRALQPQPARL